MGQLIQGISQARHIKTTKNPPRKSHAKGIKMRFPSAHIRTARQAKRRGKKGLPQLQNLISQKKSPIITEQKVKYVRIAHIKVKGQRRNSRAQ